MDKYQYNKILSEKICDNLPTLFSALNIEMEDCGKYYRSRCFVHDGDNEGALNLYPYGYTIRGYWRCNSHHCEEIFGKTILGFIWGVLSSKEGWKEPHNKKTSWSNVQKFLDKTFGKQEVIINENKDYDMSNLFSAPKLVQTKLTRQIIRQKLKIPAEFYLKRGYSFDILDKYDIGLCDTQYKEMSNRIVVPIYDDDYRYMIKCVGRSKYDQCKLCKLCHDPNYDCDKVKYKYVKWKNQENVRDYLFNYWFAKKYIQQTKSICLVESPGNVLRLEEAGIHNSLAIFGTNITDIQRIKLEMSGAMNCLLIMDNDANEAGQIASDMILQKLSRIMNIITYQTKTNDIGNMSVKDVQEEILPLIKKMENKYV